MSLLCFEAVSGLKINILKLEIIPVCEVDGVESLASIMGCGVALLPLKYLGLPLGAPYKSTSIWISIVENMERRLAGWKRLYLSKGGRLTLIKNNLSNLPTYHLSLFPIPIGVPNWLEKLHKDFFLWGDINEEFKFHLVDCSKICSPKQTGGLGVKNLIQFNQALLDKWLWCYTMEREPFSRMVVEAKYDNMSGGWCPKEVEGSFWSWGVETY